MSSVRLGDELEAKLRRAARQSGETRSEFVRAAVDMRCHRVLAKSLASAWKDSIAQFASEDSFSSKIAGKQMADDLARKHTQRKGRRAS